MEEKATNVVKPKEKNITFKVCATTIINEYDKAKDEFDKMSYSEKKELSIKRHLEENGYISIPVEGKSIDKNKVKKEIKKAVERYNKSSKDEISK